MRDYRSWSALFHFPAERYPEFEHRGQVGVKIFAISDVSLLKWSVFSCAFAGSENTLYWHTLNLYMCDLKVISSSNTNRKVYFQGNCTARGSRARWITGPSRRGNPCWLRRGRREGGSLWIYWICSDHLGLVNKNILEWWELSKETILTIEGIRT